MRKQQTSVTPGTTKVIRKDAEVELKGSNRKCKNRSGGGNGMKQIKQLKWNHKNEQNIKALKICTYGIRCSQEAVDNLPRISNRMKR